MRKLQANFAVLFGLLTATLTGCTDSSHGTSRRSDSGRTDSKGAFWKQRETSHKSSEPHESQMRLVGTWRMELKLDEQKLNELARTELKKAAPGAEPTEELMSSAVKALKRVFGGMQVSVTFHNDGTSTSRTRMPTPPMFTESSEETENGTWKVVREAENSVTFKITATDGEHKGDTTEFTVRFEDKSTFVVTSASAKELEQIPGTMTFKRQPAGKPIKKAQLSGMAIGA